VTIFANKQNIFAVLNISPQSPFPHLDGTFKNNAIMYLNTVRQYNNNVGEA
jgi:hypothetical protein